MKSAFLLKSKPNRSFLFYIVLSGGLLFGCLSLWSLRDHETINFFLALFFFFACFYHIFFIDELEIYTDRIEIKKRTRRKKEIIFFQEIKNCSAETLKDQRLTNTILTIQSGNKKYKIVSSNYANYFELQSLILKKTTAKHLD